MGKNLWRRLKGRIYYYVCGCIVRLFHPSIWKLAEDLEQFYEDYHPWGHEDGMSHLPEDGLSPDMASAVLYSAVDIWRWKHEHDKQVSEMIADLDDSELIERGKDILQRLLLYRKDRKGKKAHLLHPSCIRQSHI